MDPFLRGRDPISQNRGQSPKRVQTLMSVISNDHKLVNATTTDIRVCPLLRPDPRRSNKLIGLRRQADGVDKLMGSRQAGSLLHLPPADGLARPIHFIDFNLSRINASAPSPFLICINSAHLSINESTSCFGNNLFSAIIFIISDWDAAMTSRSLSGLLDGLSFTARTHTPSPLLPSLS